MNADPPPDEAAPAGIADAGLAEADHTVTLATAATAARAPKPAPEPFEDALERGSAVGRYVISDVLGAGGMGVVYQAYDPQLNRGIALKLLSTKRRGESDATQARARLEREAQALAQLSHPNVVAVYDVGRFEDSVFIAMELVEGQTLKEWRASRPRTQREILEVFGAAGRGLAAAHRAGLVHRDFKPGNVLVGNDGRVRVVDFGLARASDGTAGANAMLGGAFSELSGEDNVEEPGSISQETLGSRTASTAGVAASLTRVGTLVGTPQYMAPEQFLGEQVGPAADQFGFCVALYEALYGKRPFRGKDLNSLQRKVVTGRLSEPPPEARVPGWLRKILLRGLSVPCDERYASMDALLADLASDPAARRRRWMAVGALAATVALAGAFASRGAESSPLCQGANEELTGHWDDSRRAAVQASFLSSGVPYAASAFERVSAGIDDYAGGWVDMRTEACAATHIRGTQSERLLDLRMSCLNRRLDGLTALVTVFTGVIDAKTVKNALPAVFGLSRLDACADEGALTAAIPPPEDPAERKRVDSLRRRMEEARAHMKTGHYRKGLDVLETLAPELERVTYSPLQAEMLLLTGRLQLSSSAYKEAFESMTKAGLEGARAGDQALVVNAWLGRTAALTRIGNYDEALQAQSFLEAAAVLSGDDPQTRSALDNVLGDLYQAKRDFDKALEHHRAAFERLEAELGGDHPSVALALNDVANDESSLGNKERARTYHERALAIYEKAYGDDHPQVAVTIYNLATYADADSDYPRSEQMFGRALNSFRKVLGEDHHFTGVAYYAHGVALYNLGRLGEAEPQVRRSLAIREAIFGRGHVQTANSLLALGVVLNGAERLEEAGEYLHRAKAAFEKAYGAEDARVGTTLLHLADNLSRRGEFAKAKPLYARSLSIARAGDKGDEAYAVGEGHETLGDALQRAGRCKEAQQNFEKARTVYAALFDADHAKQSIPLAGIARCHLEAGRPDQARALLERAVAIRHKHPDHDAYRTAEMEGDLARALWSDPAERERALTLARRARDAFARDARPSAADHAAALDDWLGQRATR